MGWKVTPVKGIFAHCPIHKRHLFFEISSGFPLLVPSLLTTEAERLPSHITIKQQSLGLWKPDIALVIFSWHDSLVSTSSCQPVSCFQSNIKESESVLCALVGCQVLHLGHQTSKFWSVPLQWKPSGSSSKGVAFHKHAKKRGMTISLPQLEQ